MAQATPGDWIIEGEAMPSIYGCFRCGTMMHDVVYDEDSGFGVCGECNEVAVVMFGQALDILNDLYLKGVFENFEIEAPDEENEE